MPNNARKKYIKQQIKRKEDYLEKKKKARVDHEKRNLKKRQR